MNLVPSDDPGLVILPTHRVIRRRPARSGDGARRSPGTPLPHRAVSAGRRQPACHPSRRRWPTSRGGTATGIACALYTGGREILVMELTDPTVPQAFAGRGARCRPTRNSTWRSSIDCWSRRSWGFRRRRRPTIASSTRGMRRARWRPCGRAKPPPPSSSTHPAWIRCRPSPWSGSACPRSPPSFYPKVLSGLVMSPLDEEG